MNCTRCNVEIQPSTGETTGGLCMPCFKGNNKRFDVQNDPRYPRLIEQLNMLGCPNPEEWATNEILEGTPELSRFDFLREVALLVLKPGEHQYLRGCQHTAGELNIAEVDCDNGPYQRLKESGANLDDVVEIARYAQISAFADFAAIIDGRTKTGPHVEDASWALYDDLGYDAEVEECLPRHIDDLNIYMFHEDVMASLNTPNEATDTPSAE